MTPNERLDELADELEEALEDNEIEGCSMSRFRGELTLTVPVELWLQVANLLHDHKALQFEECIDVCGVDYSQYGASEWATSTASADGFGRGVERDNNAAFDPASRYAAVYHLLSIKMNHRIRVKVFLDEEKPIVDSVINVWRGVDWFEREAFDLYGIMFKGHPDLRRILTDYGFIGHPFRKDFPLTGTVEMRYDETQQRVVYEPTNIDPRVLVPRVIREDNRYTTPEDFVAEEEPETEEDTDS